MITCNRYHDLSFGHRVVGHEGKCRSVHGHNYRITFFARATAGSLDDIGRVIDFSWLKTKLCDWLESEWDHKLMLWEQDPLLHYLEQKKDFAANATEQRQRESLLLGDVFDLATVPFNPTAENIGHHLLHIVAPLRLLNTGVTVNKVIVEETRKCSITATL